MLLQLSESDPSKSERFHLKGLDWSMQLGWDLVSSVHVCGVHNKTKLSSWVLTGLRVSGHIWQAQK